MTNKNCIIRLVKYKSALYRLKNLGFIKVFSDNLADAIGATSSQVRKDFSIFGISGNRRGGYFIDELIEKLNNILGKNNIQKAIVVGTGKIGTALMNYKGFEKEGIKIVAGFDINSDKCIEQTNIPIYPMNKLAEVVTEHKIIVGIIAVPDIAAQQVLDQMVLVGIKGVLNFAPIRLRCPQDFVVNNVNLCLELETVIYYVQVAKKEKGYENNNA